jgi:hypothetical protein
VKSYIEDGTYRVRTARLNILNVGADTDAGAIVTTTGDVKPVKIINRDSNGLSFYASDGMTEIARLDDSGNLLLLGGVGSL